MSALKLAIPSKGRLKERCEDFLAGCGFQLRQKGGERGYRAELAGLPEADVLLLSASEIAEAVIKGDVHVGVTGEDLLHETSPDLERDAAVIKRLGFGGADVVVAAPQAWLDVSTMADLEAAAALFHTRHGRRMRVATKYVRLTRGFFATRAVRDYRIVESAGATEAAPASGAAELIVDITSTGATLKANGLKTLDDGVILRSQAALAGSLKAEWGEAALSALRALLDAMEARAEAGARRLLSLTAAPSDALAAAHGLTLLSGGLQALCDVGRAAEAARALAGAGCGPVSIGPLDFVFDDGNPIYDDFLRRIRLLA